MHALLIGPSFDGAACLWTKDWFTTTTGLTKLHILWGPFLEFCGYRIVLTMMQQRHMHVEG